MSYRFRFYGRSPADFFEGANDGHRYEVAFREAPDASQRTRIAETFEKRFAGGPASGSEAPLLWSGRHLHFAVGERWHNAWRATFASVSEWLLQVAHPVPIEQVIFLGTRQPGTSGWDAWSAEQGPPAAGPPYDPPLADHGAYRRPTDASLPTMAPDPEVEAARQAVRTQIRETKAARMVAKASKKTPLVPFDSERVRAHEDSLPALTASQRAAFDVPDPQYEQRKYPHGDFMIRWHLDGDDPRYHLTRPWAYVMRENSRRGLAYLDDRGRRREVENVPQDKWRFHNLLGPWIPLDGRTMYFVVGPTVYVVDVEEGEARVFAQPQLGNLLDVALLDDLWAIKTRDALLLVDAAADFEVVVRQKCEGVTCKPVLGGAVLLVVDPYKKRLEAWGRKERTLGRVLVCKAPLRAPREIDGAVVCSVDGSDDCVELAGLEDAYAKWWAKGTKKKTKRTKKKTAAKNG